MMFGLGTTAFATEEAGMVFGDENESLATTTGNELLDELMLLTSTKRSHLQHYLNHD